MFEEDEDEVLSPHMVARWYRPTEIILGSDKYDQKVDIWGIGCVFAEIVYMWSQENNKIVDPNNRYLFKGNSCYPLSPTKTEGSKDEINININD
jgi:serine/threonine protein kinase